MAFRDDEVALRARADSLQRDVERLAEELRRSQDQCARLQALLEGAGDLQSTVERLTDENANLRDSVDWLQRQIKEIQLRPSTMPEEYALRLGTLNDRLRSFEQYSDRSGSWMNLRETMPLAVECIWADRHFDAIKLLEYGRGGDETGLVRAWASLALAEQHEAVGDAGAADVARNDARRTLEALTGKT